MKTKITALLLAFGLLISFAFVRSEKPVIRLNGTWALVSGTTITKGVSSVIDYSKDQRMI
jgi:hypothetical protein